MCRAVFLQGPPFSQALDNVQEALALHLEGIVADGGELPQGKDVDAHLENPDYVGGIWAIVDFDLTPYLGKSVRSMRLCQRTCCSVLMNESAGTTAMRPVRGFWPQRHCAS